MQAFEQAAGQRLWRAVQLTAVPQVAVRLQRAEADHLQCCRVLDALLATNRQLARLLELRNAHAVLAALLARVQKNEPQEYLAKAIHVQISRVTHPLQHLRGALMNDRYPLAHAQGEIPLGEYLLPRSPREGDLGAIFDAARAMIEGLPTLHFRLLAWLAVVAEDVEMSLGLPLLPEPAQQSAASSPAASAEPEPIPLADNAPIPLAD
jgi:hypothetical protein